jgi:hypothetical protein
MSSDSAEAAGRTDHQGIAGWAERGAKLSDERVSPEQGAAADAPDDLSLSETGGTVQGLDSAGDTSDDLDTVTGSAGPDETSPVPPFAGEPGATTDPGSEAVSAAYEGDGAYSYGRAAGSGLSDDVPTGVPQELAD